MLLLLLRSGIVVGVAVCEVVVMVLTNTFTVAYATAMAALLCLVAWLLLFRWERLFAQIDRASFMRMFSFYQRWTQLMRVENMQAATAPAFREDACVMCLSRLQVGARYCYQCGTPVDHAFTFKLCYQCERSMPLNAVFCPVCRFPMQERVTDGSTQLARVLHRKVQIEVLPEDEVPGWINSIPQSDPALLAPTFPLMPAPEETSSALTHTGLWRAVEQMANVTTDRRPVANNALTPES